MHAKFTGIGLLDLKLNSLECSQQESPKMSVFFFRLLLEKGPENWRQRPGGDEMMSVGQHIADEVACRDIPSFARLLILWLSITCTTMSWTCTVQHAGYCMHVRTAHVHIADGLTWLHMILQYRWSKYRSTTVTVDKFFKFRKLRLVLPKTLPLKMPKSKKSKAGRSTALSKFRDACSAKNL